MPTIDQLAPATAASDNDELLVSQSGIARKVTRAQVLAGVQPQVAIGSGTLLGRASAGTGGPEQINIGTNLTLTNGALSASAAPFNVAMLTAGTVPSSSDLIPLGQGGGNIAVTYGQFMSGLAGITNVDVSQLLVMPTGGKSPSKLGDLAANTLMLTGGTLTGTLTLAADPTVSLQAATKKYVDAQVGTALPKIGGTLSGSLVLAADPTTSQQAATKQYVDGQVATAVPKIGGTLTGALTLAADPASLLQATAKTVCRYACIARRRHTHGRAGARRRSDVDAPGLDKGICRHAGSRRSAQGRRHAYRCSHAGSGPHLVDACSDQALCRCAGRHIVADRRRRSDRPAGTAIESGLRVASG